MEGLIMAAQIILSLSILVGLHELGHLVAAKVFGMRVEQYSIGFPPKIFGVKWRDTEYSLGAIPLGGYVKISGMIDESLDTDAMKEEPKDYEFRSKPAWQRLIVMLGGIIVNVVTGVLIFFGVVYYWGDQYLSTEEVNKYGIESLEIGQDLGLQTGDRIIELNGKSFEDFGDIQSPEFLLGDKSTYTIDRAGEIVKIEIPSNFVETISTKENLGKFVMPRVPFLIGEVSKDSPADKAGIMVGDKIIRIGDTPIHYYDEYQTLKGNYAGVEMPIVVLRGTEELEMVPVLGKDSVLGFYADRQIQFSFTQYSLGEAFSEGSDRAFSAVWVNIMAFGKMFKGEISATKSLSGPLRIAQIFGGTWDWQRFWKITGLLSMVLAFMNFLPIPALDGGHVMFLSYEIISGRSPGDKFLEYAQRVGMVFLLGLMAFVIVNDFVQSWPWF